MTLAQRIEAVLPQTQCRRCGYPDCRGYAQAIAAGGAAINRCPPGGAEGVERLAVLTGRPSMPLDPACGAEGPLARALIDEAWCIGCTLCIAACPVDCIAGASKRMHTVITAQCTGCALCLPACPVDCITMAVDDPTRTGWAAWSADEAAAARMRYAARNRRRARAADDRDPSLGTTGHGDGSPLSHPNEMPAADAKRALLEAALARARSAR